MGRKLDVVAPASSEGWLIFFISSFQPQAENLRRFLLPGHCSLSKPWCVMG